jgi:tetratricopeptide (TPR) repeat protein
MQWCERTDFNDAVESQALINIFGARKNYAVNNPAIDFQKLMDFLLDGYLREKVALPPKLNGTLHLAKFWLLLSQGKSDEAIVLLEAFLVNAPQNLHCRTELAKIYQRQNKLKEAEEIAEEVLAIDPLNDHAVSELLAIWRRQGEKEKCAQRFMEFIAQPAYRFSRYSQAPFYRFFQCCKAFNMGENADLIFQRFRSKLDDMNLNYYMGNF